ncbi:hypothetical protein P154DRAFT_530800 [Amniculicola lignicola CBS 123094]|uniref:Uncharacterized protein n=1 Tax=Amniculicola lignicola CBS 123094 TaxID=1392246 RepID=A0A6A5WWL1_9PLEO|nr:hypothetical protein P154DRAFT_530800 [Amniculicola lignicola CBS 123094]
MDNNTSRCNVHSNCQLSHSPSTSVHASKKAPAIGSQVAPSYPAEEFGRGGWGIGDKNLPRDMRPAQQRRYSLHGQQRPAEPTCGQECEAVSQKNAAEEQREHKVRLLLPEVHPKHADSIPAKTFIYVNKDLAVDDMVMKDGKSTGTGDLISPLDVSYVFTPGRETPLKTVWRPRPAVPASKQSQTFRKHAG